ncbi:MAG: adenylate kinase family protein [Candidatus Freyarchaeota archaeon]
MGRAIVISGCPGTGKTTLSSRLAKILGAELVGLGEVVEREKLYSHIDAERNTKVADLDRLIPRLVELIEAPEGFVIVEGHYSDIVPSEYVHVAIVLRTHPETLKKRLESKGWKEKKIIENVQAEILGSCTFNALEAYGNELVYEIDTTNLPKEETVSIAQRIVEEKTGNYKAGKIDWLSMLDAYNELDKYFE